MVLTEDKNRIVFLNNTGVVSVKEGLEILQEIKKLGGDLEPDSELEKSIESLLKGETLGDIDQIIDSLSRRLEDEKGRGDEQISKEKLDELVADYEEQLKNGADSQSTLESIVKNNPNLTRENIQRFIDKQKELKKDVKPEEKPKSREDEEKEIKSDSKTRENVNDEKTTQSIKLVESKIDDLSRKITEEVGGDEKVEEKVKTELEEIIKQEAFKSDEEELKDLIDAVAKGEPVTPELEIKVKKIKLEIDSWKTEHIEEVRDYKKAEFEEKFVSETEKENKNLTEEQRVAVKEKAKLVSKVIFSDGGIEDQEKTVIESNREKSPGQVKNSWNDLVVTAGFMRMSSEETMTLLNEDSNVNSRLDGVKIPYENFPQVRAYDDFNALMTQGSNLDVLKKIQSGGGAIRRISRLTGGWWDKGMMKFTNHFASRIGNKATSEFVKSAMGVLMKDGLKGGLSTILKGVLGKGALGAAGAAAGVATGPVGWVVTAALFAKKLFDKTIGKLLSKLGLSFKNSAGKGANKLGSSVVKIAVGIVAIPAILIGSMGTAIAGPVVIGAVVGLFAVNSYTATSLTSSLVPNVPKCGGLEQNYTKGTIDSKCDQSGRVMGTNQCSAENSKLTMNARCSSHTVCTSGCGMVSTSIILQCHDAKNTPKCLLTSNMGCKSSFFTHQGACPISWTSMSETLMMNLGKNALFNNGKKISCNKAKVSEMLCSGWVAIVHFRRDADKTGHWLVAAAVTTTGDIALADPSYSEKKFNYWSDFIADRHAHSTYCLFIRADKI